MHVCSCMHILFIIVSLRYEGEGGQPDMQSTCCWRGTLFLTWGKITVLSIFSLSFNGGGSICGCMCVYICTHTHTHTANGTLECEPRGRRRRDTLRAWIIQIDQISAYMYAYVSTKYTCVSVLRGGIRCSANCFFLQHVFPAKKEKQKIWSKTEHSNPHGFELHRP